MKLLLQIGFIFSLCLIGEGVSTLLPFPFPSSVLSLLFLLILLLLKWVKPSHIEDFAQFLLKNMAFFFIPAGVDIINYFDLLRSNVLQILLVCLFSTFITFAVSAFTVSAVIKLQNRKKQGEDIHA